MEATGQRPLVSALILAGGHGERLGRDKATLQVEGQPLVQRVISRLAGLSADVVVVARRGQALQVEGARLTFDLAPYTGGLAAIAAGLEATRFPWSIVVACDMPFLNVDLLRYMLTLTEGCDIVVPRLEMGVEPLHALYHKRCLPPLREALAKGQRRIISFYAPLRVRYVEAEELDHYDPLRRSFFNINTVEELAQAQQWLRSER